MNRRFLAVAGGRSTADHDGLSKERCRGSLGERAKRCSSLVIPADRERAIDFVGKASVGFGRPYHWQCHDRSVRTRCI